jgi:hypothetical protein
MSRQPIRAVKVAQHYGVPTHSYEHGKSRIKLRLCSRCWVYRPVDHECEPVNREEMEEQ